MTKEEFNTLNNKLAPEVEKIIKDNYYFCGINQTIKWCFVLTNTPSVLATCSRETNVISIDINAFNHYFENNNLIEAEYFLIHEMRHIFQQLQIKEYMEKKKCEVCEKLVEKWIYENKHYEVALDKDGNENPKYFAQDVEFDAYAFSYAVIKYKYGDVKVYIPPMYKQEFIDVVNEWITIFKDEVTC